MRMSDWSSDVCSSDLEVKRLMEEAFSASDATGNWSMRDAYDALEAAQVILLKSPGNWTGIALAGADAFASLRRFERALPTQTYRSEHQVEMQQFSRSEEQPSELQSLLRHSYDVCGLKKKTHRLII